jgi:putative ABC transport system ATP-binding protein
VTEAIRAEAGRTTPDHLTATDAIGRGLSEVPILREGLALTWLFAAGSAAGRVITPIVIQQAIDRGIGDDGLAGGDVDMRFIWICAAIAAAAQIVSAYCTRTAIVRLGERSETALCDLRRRLIGHIHRISLADHNDERRGALVARVTSDIESLTQFFRWGGIAWLINGTLMLIVAAVMLAYNWLLAVITIAVSIPLFWLLRFVQRHLVAAYTAGRERNSEMLANIGEMVSGAATIRVYGAGTMFSRRAHRASKARSDAQARANQIAASLFPLGELFSVVTISAVVVVGVTAGPGRGLTAGALIGFVFLAYRFLEPIAEFTEILDQTQTAVAGLRRVLGVLDMPVGPPQPSQAIALPDGRLDIDVVDVTFAYTNRSLSSGLDAPVLHRIDAHIPAGQQIALIGETGSGKTTLGRLIARLADPVGGEIRLGDIPLTQVDNSELRRRLVVVAQEPFLFDDTIAANVRFASPDADDASIDRIVEQLDIADWVRSLPNGLDTMVGERGAGLSAHDDRDRTPPVDRRPRRSGPRPRRRPTHRGWSPRRARRCRWPLRPSLRGLALVDLGRLVTLRVRPDLYSHGRPSSSSLLPSPIPSASSPPWMVSTATRKSDAVRYLGHDAVRHGDMSYASR